MQEQRPQKRRAILTEQQAVDIFECRSTNSISMVVSSASFVANRYGINERTVRDIWKQRTWARTTNALAGVVGQMAEKKLGRPIGSKESRPRKKRLATGIPISSRSQLKIVYFNDWSGTDDAQEKDSIDDQLHTWANDTSPWCAWIIAAALPLDRPGTSSLPSVRSPSSEPSLTPRFTRYNQFKELEARCRVRHVERQGDGRGIYLLHPATPRRGDQAVMPTPRGRRRPPSHQGGGGLIYGIRWRWWIPRSSRA
jgi:hypothetical protein